ncbi:MAG: KGGVGR-motif variant AAA ATPase, partial [Polyangiales bacterium]
AGLTGLPALCQREGQRRPGLAENVDPMSVAPSAPSPYQVYTFYTYKGGVGCSMAAANVAAMLAKSNKRVLLVDWDLDAPSLERFFQHFPTGLSHSRADVPGVVDWLLARQRGSELDWRSCIIRARPQPIGQPIDFISAGQDRGDYVAQAQSLDWRTLLSPALQIEQAVEALRSAWIREYDYVLIDSRTGLNDQGGLCTALLPDVLVLFFTTTHLSMEGALEHFERAATQRQSRYPGRAPLVGVPVLGRDERDREYVRSREWQHRIAKRLQPVYATWLPSDVSALQALQKIYIPTVPYLSFGEPLPVVDNQRELSDPRSSSAALARLARLLGDGLNWATLDATSEASELANYRAQLASSERHASLIEALAQKRRKRSLLFAALAALATAIALGAVAINLRLSQDVKRGANDAERYQAQATQAEAQHQALLIDSVRAGVSEVRVLIDTFSANVTSLERVHATTVESAVVNAEELRRDADALAKRLAKLRQQLTRLPTDNPASSPLRETVNALSGNLRTATRELAHYEHAVREIMQAPPSTFTRGLRAARDAWRLGYRQLQRGKLEAAERRMNEAIRILDRFAPPYNALGEIALRRGKLDVAERHFRTALRKSPYNVVALASFAELALKRGKREQAQIYATKALKARPNFRAAQRIVTELRTRRRAQP